MNLLIFLDLTYNPCKNVKFYSLQGQNFKIFHILTCNQGKVSLILPIFTHNQGKVFLILPITRGAHVYLVSIGSFPLPPLVRMHSDVVLSSSGALLIIETDRK